ncbi:hypothetical protein [Brevibacillus sp. SYSU BS000544]|uniref:hypothetical protein n=1 Tax=Brevibacillus sp. SYSU BS000544 TaxID=3416443 RepID=UPI003CE46E4C
MSLQRVFIFVQIGMLLVFSLLPLPVFAEDTNWNRVFTKQVHDWIDNLSSKDEQFKEWKDAKTNIQALGPNSRQWLVTLQVRNKPVGYLIVEEDRKTDPQSDMPSFILLEYGLGEYILFNESTQPKQFPGQPVYDGFASFWKISQNGTTQYVDAKTGEQYPTIVKPDNPVMSTLAKTDLAQAGLALTRHTSLGTTLTDPFDQIDWMFATPVSAQNTEITWQDLWKTTDQEAVVVTASLFQDEVMAPFTVGSLHVWGENVAYIGVWDEGLRFLPSAYITKVGKIIH